MRPPTARVKRLTAKGRGLALGLLLASALISALCVLTPVAASRGGSLLPALVYNSCSHLCHQKPERSFVISGQLMPLCVRCTGIVSGFTIGALLLCLVCIEFQPRLACFAIVAAPMTLDGTAQLLKLYPSPSALRYITGLLFGVACMTILVPAILPESQTTRGSHE